MSAKTSLSLKSPLLDRVRIVLLDCAYDTWGNSFTKEIFHKTVDLKISGYRREYPYGVLPIDTSDFVGTHLIACIEEEGSLNPIMAYRSISLERSKKHRMALPAQTLMKLLGAKDHEVAVKEIVDRCEQEKKDVAYASSLTVRDDFKGSLEVRDILKAMHVLYHQDYEIPEVIGGGVLRFKVDQFYKFWGYERLSLGGAELSPLPVPFVFDEITGFFHLSAFSPEAKAFAAGFKAIWENRLTVDSKMASASFANNKKVA